MELEQLIAKLYSSSKNDDVHKVIKELNIKPNYPIILVTGTNGKGSTCNYLSTMLKLAGYKVGLFTSPHLLRVNERIQINNQEIDDETLVNTLEMLSNYSLGFFSAVTLACHLIFTQEKIDIAIIEVGIGGRLDVTNLFEPTVSAITNIALDHCDKLGETIEQIALEKAAIYRPYKYAFFAGNQQLPLSIIKHANKIKTKLNVLGRDFGFSRNDLSFNVWTQAQNYYTLPYPALRGEEQLYNATLAIAIISKLNKYMPVSISHIKSGLLQMTILGRFQVIPGRPQIVLDVAHNPASIKVMLNNMLKLSFAKNTYAVFGINCDKDINKIIELCRNRFTKWFIAKTNSDNATTIDEITKKLLANNISNTNIISNTSITKAIESVIKIAKEDDQIICFGSFSVVAEVYQYIKDNNI